MTAISQLRPEHYDDLRDLFRIYECSADPSTYDPDWTLVALVDNKAVGFIAAWVCGQPYVFVDTFLVRPEHRGTGVAVRLGETMLAVLEKRKMSAGKTIRAVVTLPSLIEPLKKYSFRTVSAAVAMER